MISVLVRTKDRITATQEVKKRIWKLPYVSKYREEISSIDWDDFYSATDLSVKNSIFEQKVVAAIEKFAPMKKIQLHINHRNWLDEECKNLMKERDNMRESAKVSGDQNEWRQYRSLRNRCTALKKINKN